MAPPAAIEVLPESDTSTFTIPDRLTIQSVAKRRAASGKLLAGVAAAANVGTFKGQTHHLHKSKAKRWDDRLTAEAKARSGSSLKEAAKFLKQPGLISRGGGLPSTEYFPVVWLFDLSLSAMPSVGPVLTRVFDLGGDEHQSPDNWPLHARWSARAWQGVDCWQIRHG